VVSGDGKKGIKRNFRSILLFLRFFWLGFWCRQVFLFGCIVILCWDSLSES